jgi:hypothetical protein
MIKTMGFLVEAKGFSVGMTRRLCHSEGAFWRLKNLSMSKTGRFLVEAKNFSVGMTMVNWWLSDPLL